MFFLIDDQKKVVAKCRMKNEVSVMVMNYFNSKLKVPAIQTIAWEIILKDGYFYHKNGDDYELREYKISEGWMYSSLYYEVLGKYHVCEFDGKQQSKLKSSFVESVNNTVLVEPPCPLTPRAPLIDEE